MRWLLPLVALLATLGSALASDFNDEMQPENEAAMKKGLAYLAATQRPDGAWSSGNGPSTGIVGACCVAFLANGQVPGSGEYGTVVAKGLDYLLKNAQPNGFIFNGGEGGPMYHHGLATLALAEAWGQSQEPQIRDALKRAVELICNSQNQRGGWRYQPHIGDDDLSASVMMLMALRAAKDAGLEVPKDVIDAGIAYVKSCHNGRGQGKDGGFAYTPGGDSGFARTAAGVTSLQVAGNYKAAEVSEGVDYLLKFKPLGTQTVEEGFYAYGLYYATMGIYQAQSIGSWGRKAWSSWYPAVTRSLVATQQADGHWTGSHDQFPTATALLILAIPCRYLPIYQR
jgi:prenyltransferase beta subunit